MRLRPPRLPAGQLRPSMLRHARTAPAAPPPGFVPPYSLPAAGQARLIGTNTPAAVRPGTFSTAEWNYAIAGSYGAGVYARDYSAGGAYVLAGTGGHGHPSIYGVFGFDYATEAFFYSAAANSGAADNPALGVPLAQTNGSPYFEMNAAAGVPAPPHPYQHAWYRPPSLGGGPKGSFVYPSRAAVCSDSLNSTAVHAMDLDSRLWTRENNSQAARSAVECSSIWAPTLGRVYVIDTALHANSNFVFYTPGTSAAAGAFGTTSGFGFPPSPTGGAYIRAGQQAYVQGGKEWAVIFRDAQLLVANLTDNTVPTVATVSGTLPSSGSMSWVFDPVRNKFFGWSGSGQTLRRLTPPAGSPASGTWVLDSITLTGDTVPAYDGSPGVSVAYRALHYVESLNLLGLFLGGVNPMCLINPE